MLDFGSIMIGTMQLEKMAEFYEKVFNREPDMKDGKFFGWMVGKTFLTIGEHSEVNGQSENPARIILNFETPEVKEEAARLKELGAKVVEEPYEMGGAWIATLADPDGNYFQLMSPWDDVKNEPKT